MSDLIAKVDDIATEVATAVGALDASDVGADPAGSAAAAQAAAEATAANASNLTSGTVADARIASTIARDSEVTSAISALSSVYQPLDSDLTAIAALTTTSFGRGLLALADAAALRASAGLDDDLATLSLPASTTISTFGASLIDDTAASNARTTLGLGTAAVAATGDFDAAGAAAAAQAASQPLDSDLTAIAALSTTSYGRAFLALANAAAGISALGLDADLATLSLPASTTITAAAATVLDDTTTGAMLTTLGAQPVDSDLTAIAAIAPTNDDIIQRKSGAWVARSMAQVKTDLALAKADVGLGNVDNTSDATKNAATATLTNKTIDGSQLVNTSVALTTKVTGILPAANGGTGASSFGTWTTYVPTVDQGVSTSIANTLAFARYTQMGKTVIGALRLTLTAGGTAGSEISISPPVTPNTTDYGISFQAGSAFVVANGAQYKCLVRVTFATGRFAFTLAGDTTTANPLGQTPSFAAASGNVFTMTFMYEAA